jgi:hypothetical protein
MTIYLNLYIIFWLILVTIWFVLLIKNYKDIILFKKDYTLFLAKKWKVWLLMIAMLSLCYVSTLWYDPSWDIPETIIMSLFTFYFSPYSIWIFHRYFNWMNKNKIELYIAIILMFFSTCWFYDFYSMIFLLWYYPPMAFSNLLLSPFFYILAWIMWNLDYKTKTWIIFTCNEKEWINLKWDDWNFKKIFIYILPIIIFMIFIFWYFIYINN